MDVDIRTFKVHLRVHVTIPTPSQNGIATKIIGKSDVIENLSMMGRVRRAARIFDETTVRIVVAINKPIPITTSRNVTTRARANLVTAAAVASVRLVRKPTPPVAEISNWFTGGLIWVIGIHPFQRVPQEILIKLGEWEIFFQQRKVFVRSTMAGTAVTRPSQLNFLPFVIFSCGILTIKRRLAVLEISVCLRGTTANGKNSRNGAR